MTYPTVLVKPFSPVFFAMMLLWLNMPSNVSAQTSCLPCEEIYSAGQGYNHRFDSQGTLFRACEDGPDLLGDADVTCHNNWRWGACAEHNTCGSGVIASLSQLERFLGELHGSGDVHVLTEMARWLAHEPNVSLSASLTAFEVSGCEGQVSLERTLSATEMALVSRFITRRVERSLVP